MSLFQFFGLSLEVMMMILVFVMARFAASAEYNGRGLWHITVRSFIRRDKTYLDWSKANMEYLWASVLVISLCVIIISMVPPFSQNRMLVRPEAAIFVSPILYLSIIRCYVILIKKRKSI